MPNKGGCGSEIDVSGFDSVEVQQSVFNPSCARSAGHSLNEKLGSFLLD